MLLPNCAVLPKISLDKWGRSGYNNACPSRGNPHGGIAQLVEHSVHTRSVICSSQIAATIRPVGQAVKTPPFHGGNMGSIPVRVTMNRLSRIQRASVFGKVYTHLQEDFKCRKGQDSWQRSENIFSSSWRLITSYGQFLAALSWPPKRSANTAALSSAPRPYELDAHPGVHGGRNARSMTL